ncbi:permease prefix domain 1-containing protein [Microbacterium sp. CJ88]|uniref:permease prefix domain 1-containing protein n=1 Tax=Microbacterium sp. CJ88 TaxID=3445672 RepID=UPI003F658905
MTVPTMSLTDRYIHAATRSLPDESRADLAAELRASIADAVDARTEAGEEPDAAERAVLVEMGDPDRLAAEYADRPLWVIGPRYFLEWWRLLKLLWAIVPACAVGGVALGMTLAGESFGSIMGTLWSVLVAVVVHIGFWTTLVFFVIERSGSNAPMAGPWTPDALPEIRERGLGFAELITSLAILGLLAGALVWDRFVGFVPGHEQLSFFDHGLWPWAMGVLFVLMAGQAALGIVVYVRGRWTMPLAAVDALIAVAVAVPALVLLLQGRLLNPDFFPTLAGESGAEVASVIGALTGFTIAGVAVWNIVDVALKARRTRRTLG